MLIAYKSLNVRRQYAKWKQEFRKKIPLQNKNG
jgi:hypothetical protein